MKNIVVFLIAISTFSGLVKTEAQVTVGVGVQVGIAPPVLPVYVQPPCPVEGYLWIPGYWAYGVYGYYWVPGVWVLPPRIGFLWTPGYWGFEHGAYFWHGGYWGPHVGFYGGVHYGFGYYGTGFYGGRWEGGAFRYNAAVWRVNSNVIHNTYSDRAPGNAMENHSSFNGPGGIEARPNAEEQSAMREEHVQPTSSQQAHEHNAFISKNQRASVNGGHPSVAARGSVGGQRYNSSGHSIASSHSTHSANGNNAAHSYSNSQHSNAGRPQAQHSNIQRSGAQRQQSHGTRASGRSSQGHSGGGRR
ncbi:MAG: YXWGXW repeat-containing protein [Bacteroidia bacterium]